MRFVLILSISNIFVCKYFLHVHFQNQLTKEWSPNHWFVYSLPTKQNWKKQGNSGTMPGYFSDFFERYFSCNNYAICVSNQSINLLQYANMTSEVHGSDWVYCVRMSEQDVIDLFQWLSRTISFLQSTLRDVSFSWIWAVIL